MEFSEVDIQEVLKHSLPKRFQDISPTDFEGFIAQLFSDLGFDVEQTPYSGDFGADLIVRFVTRMCAQMEGEANHPCSGRGYGYSSLQCGIHRPCG